VYKRPENPYSSKEALIKKGRIKQGGLENLFSFCFFGSGFVDALTSLTGGVWRCLKETVLKELVRERKKPEISRRGTQETGNNKDKISKIARLARRYLRVLAPL
jgi:hypothetical protein